MKSYYKLPIDDNIISTLCFIIAATILDLTRCIITEYGTFVRNDNESASLCNNFLNSGPTAPIVSIANGITLGLLLYFTCFVFSLCFASHNRCLLVFLIYFFAYIFATVTS